MKKIIAGIFLCCLLCLNLAFAETAENLTELCMITSPGKATDAVHDGLYTSYWRNREVKNGYLEFETPAGKSARWLYICFGEEPADWEIQVESGGQWVTKIVGEMRYAHTLLDLGAETHFRLIDTSGKKAQFKINEVYVFGDGELPDWVQDWQPTQEKADILLLAAHPDDELLFFGGTIPDYGVERGLSVVVAYMSYSNTTRKSELLNGLWSMGVRNYPVIGTFHDTYSGTLEAGYQRWKQKDVDAYITGLIRRFRPEVVLSHDVDGEYGHGAHKVTADAALRCAMNAADPSFCPESAAVYGLWEVKKVYLHLAKEQPIHMNWRIPLASQGGRTGLEAAADAYKLHKTQETTHFVVSDEDKNSCADFGLVYTTVGPDIVGGDFLENIVYLTGNHLMDAATADENGFSEPETEPEMEPETEPEAETETVPELTSVQEAVEPSEDPETETSETDAGEAQAVQPEPEPVPLFADLVTLPYAAYSDVTEDTVGKPGPRATPAPSPVSVRETTGENSRKPYADVEWPAELANAEKDEQGYPVSGEWVIADGENGVWFYASPTLVVRVDRFFEADKVLTWYGVHVFCDLDRERFGSILYDPDKPQNKHVQAKLIAKENQVVFGMNTDYYTYRLGRKTMIGMIIRNGRVFYDRVPEANRRQFPNLDTLAMYEDGSWAVYRSDERTAGEYIADGAVDVWAFGPYLVREGEINPFIAQMTNGKTEQPRCAIGMIEPGHYYALLAEGRIRNESVGVDIQFLADHMIEAGCQEALNLDGGQTAVMCFMGEQITRIGKYNGGNTSPRATTELMGIGHSDLIDPNQ